MKKTAFIALLLIIGMALVFPKPSHSCGPGWAIGVAAALVGVSLLGAAVAPAYGYYGPPAAYAYPPPAYAYPPPAYGGIGTLITDRGTILATGTVVIMDPDIMVTTDVGGE